MVVIATLLAGVTYGFAGFGAALIFMPVAAAILGPANAVAAFALTALGSLFTVLPGAWRAADRAGVSLMLGAALLTLPLGLMLLTRLDPEPLRWGISGVTLATLAILISGWRLRRAPSAAAKAAVGAGSGLVGGATGLTGPVVILFNLGRGEPAQQTRANTASFLTLLSTAVLPAMAIGGALSGYAIMAGLLLLPVYALGTWTGRRLFQPGKERLYRGTAYGLIALAVISGLPLFD